MVWTGVGFLLIHHVIITIGRPNMSTTAVCGTDGRTYKDEVELRRAQSKEADLQLLHLGPCLGAIHETLQNFKPAYRKDGQNHGYHVKVNLPGINMGSRPEKLQKPRPSYKDFTRIGNHQDGFGSILIPTMDLYNWNACPPIYQQPKMQLNRPLYVYHPYNQPSYQPLHQPSYQPLHQPYYQPLHQPSYQSVHQPSYQSLYPPSYQPIYQLPYHLNDQPSYETSYESAYQPKYTPEFEPNYHPIYQQPKQHLIRPLYVYHPYNQPSYQPLHQPSYQPLYLFNYEPSYETSYELAYQPKYTPEFEPNFPENFVKLTTKHHPETSQDTEENIGKLDEDNVNDSMEYTDGIIDNIGNIVNSLINIIKEDGSDSLHLPSKTIDFEEKSKNIEPSQKPPFDSAYSDFEDNSPKEKNTFSNENIDPSQKSPFDSAYPDLEDNLQVNGNTIFNENIDASEKSTFDSAYPGLEDNSLAENNTVYSENVDPSRPMDSKDNTDFESTDLEIKDYSLPPELKEITSTNLDENEKDSTDTDHLKDNSGLSKESDFAQSTEELQLLEDNKKDSSDYKNTSLTNKSSDPDENITFSTDFPISDVFSSLQDNAVDSKDSYQNPLSNEIISSVQDKIVGNVDSDLNYSLEDLHYLDNNTRGSTETHSQLPTTDVILGLVNNTESDTNFYPYPHLDKKKLGSDNTTGGNLDTEMGRDLNFPTLDVLSGLEYNTESSIDPFSFNQNPENILYDLEDPNSSSTNPTLNPNLGHILSGLQNETRGKTEASLEDEQTGLGDHMIQNTDTSRERLSGDTPSSFENDTSGSMMHTPTGLLADSSENNISDNIVPPLHPSPEYAISGFKDYSVNSMREDLEHDVGINKQRELYSHPNNDLDLKSPHHFQHYYVIYDPRSHLSVIATEGDSSSGLIDSGLEDTEEGELRNILEVIKHNMMNSVINLGYQGTNNKKAERNVNDDLAVDSYDIIDDSDDYGNSFQDSIENSEGLKEYNDDPTKQFLHDTNSEASASSEDKTYNPTHDYNYQHTSNVVYDKPCNIKKLVYSIIEIN